MYVQTKSLGIVILIGLLAIVAIQPAFAASDTGRAEPTAGHLDDAELDHEARSSRAQGNPAKVVTSPKFKCQPVNQAYGQLSPPQSAEVDLICPGGHFVTVAQCSQAGTPILNTLDTELIPPNTSWVNYLIVNGNGFARGVHCEVAVGRAIASAMCCANY